jgi:hypothetical protein
MASYYLVNAVQFRTSRMWPGSYVDDLSDDVPGIQTAGGILIASATTGAAAASAGALAGKQRGGAEAEAAAGMLALLAQAGWLAAGSVAATELAAGAGTTVKIGDGQVTAAKWADGAGVAALLAAGLGASAVVDHAGASPQTLMVADATHDRAVLLVVTCTEDMGGTTEPTVDIGWTADDDGLMDQLRLVGATAGEVFISAGLVPVTNAVIATIVNGTGTVTGAFSVVLIVLPTA